jgi:hypothetical protein
MFMVEGGFCRTFRLRRRDAKSANPHAPGREKGVAKQGARG